MRLGFVVLPRSSVMTFSCAIEAFRLANEMARSCIFECLIVSVAGLTVEMDGGVKLNADVEIDAAPLFDMIFVVSSLNGVEYRNSHFEAWLRARHRAGAILAPLGCATVLAARAGLLDGHHCVTHWTLYDRFRTEFPAVHLIQGLFRIDGSIVTAAGGISAFDLGLALVQQSSTASSVEDQAEIALHQHPRTAIEHQRSAITWRYGVQDERLVRAITLMEKEIECPVSVGDLASAADLSERQFERVFRKSLGIGPIGFYQGVRLRRAQNLLRTTAMPIAEIALRSGFSDASHLSREYRRHFKESPSQTREGSLRFLASVPISTV
jgi:transcriptional regulator GlxA family with amidase domain